MLPEGVMTGSNTSAVRSLSGALQASQSREIQGRKTTLFLPMQVSTYTGGRARYHANGDELQSPAAGASTRTLTIE